MFSLHIRIPPKIVREKFHIIYELEGCQKAVNFLTNYYGVRKMRIVLNGKKVGNRYTAQYFENKAIFTKRGFNKRTVLHEFYHHLANVQSLELASQIEEKEASSYVKFFFKK